MRRSNSVGSSEDVELAHSGEAGTADFRLQAVEPTRGQKISLWHDISLVHVDPDTRKETEFLNFVCEIPKFTRFATEQFLELHLRFLSSESHPLCC
jgi:hypothetical protein